MVALIGWFGWMDVLVLSALLLLCFALLWYVLINGLVWVICCWWKVRFVHFELSGLVVVVMRLVDFGC